MKKEVVKMEGSLGSTSFADHISSGYQFQGMLDFPESEKSSVGFMELLGMQDFSPSLFDMLQVPSKAPSSAPNPATAKIEKLEGLNQPATPNSSSISSESSEAANDEQTTKAVDQEEEQEKTKKQLKPKKTAQKRQREPRFAFMTKSEVDHLEDGYRWRKYGQKAVKNSPFPRSYYRCTTASCNVKKRVERSFSDPSVVVTTYEGQHTHPSPAMPRAGAPMGSSVVSGGAAAFAMPMQGSILSHYQQYMQKPLANNFSPLNFGYSGGGAVPNYPSFVNQERSICTPGSALLRDHGLLQDIVPSNMLKELKE